MADQSDCETLTRPALPPLDQDNYVDEPLHHKLRTHINNPVRRRPSSRAQICHFGSRDRSSCDILSNDTMLVKRRLRRARVAGSA